MPIAREYAHDARVKAAKSETFAWTANELDYRDFAVMVRMDWRTSVKPGPDVRKFQGEGRLPIGHFRVRNFRRETEIKMRFIDLAAQRARMGGRLERALSKVLSHDRYILGPELSEFESSIADFVGVKHAIGCANGTRRAGHSANGLLGIGRGDAVFVPSFTFTATAEAVALTGATPVFVDISRETYNLDSDRLEEAIDDVKARGNLNAKAIIPVDLFGLPANYPAIESICRKHGLIVIEDAAQSIGGRSAAGFCGAFGDVAATSFYPAKPLGCYGDGGAMFTDNDELMVKLRSIARHGVCGSNGENIHIGLNSRLDTVQAAILMEKLMIFDEELEARQKVADYYRENLRGHVRIPPTPDGMRSAWAPVRH